MLTIYALAALPFFTGGLVITLAISRLASRINAVYASDLLGAAVGCLVLIPLLDRVGAPGVVLTAAALALTAAVLFAPAASRARFAGVGAAIMAVALAGQLSGVAVFDVGDTKGHQGDRCSSASGTRSPGSASTSARTATGRSARSTPASLPDTRYMDIDSAASTPILHVEPGFVERPVPALRADRAWRTSSRSRGSRRSSSAPAAAAIWCRRSSSAPATSTASKSIRSSPTT